ncbi:MAG: NAD(P)H-quinone oxidoreductase [Myxococcales bacterium]|nr:NAD(P)H-quinone oxidoreductase [Myxococcales bacterium]
MTGDLERVPAIRFRGAGGLEVIELAEIDVRPPGVGEVTVEVVAAGLNRADLLQRRGLYPAPPGSAADVPGLELSGRVVAHGPLAGAHPLGAPVMAIVGGGAMAGKVTLHERELLAVPAGLELIAAAAIPEVFLTAWDALGQADLRAGQTVLVHAAASGVGTAALQLARICGARPLATTRSAAKVGRVIEQGAAAQDVILLEDGRFASRVMARTGRGADVILDCVGGAYLEENLRALAPGGRLVMIGTLGGATGSLSIGMMLGKRAQVIGSVMRSRPLEEKMALAQRAGRELVPLFSTPGGLRPVVDRVMKMADCAAAHEVMEANDTVGKIVLIW